MSGRAGVPARPCASTRTFPPRRRQALANASMRSRARASRSADPAANRTAALRLCGGTSLAAPGGRSAGRDSLAPGTTPRSAARTEAAIRGGGSPMATDAVRRPGSVPAPSASPPDGERPSISAEIRAARARSAVSSVKIRSCSALFRTGGEAGTTASRGKGLPLPGHAASADLGGPVSAPPRSDRAADSTVCPASPGAQADNHRPASEATTGLRRRIGNLKRMPILLSPPQVMRRGRDPETVATRSRA